MTWNAKPPKWRAITLCPIVLAIVVFGGACADGRHMPTQASAIALSSDESDEMTPDEIAAADTLPPESCVLSSGHGCAVLDVDLEFPNNNRWVVNSRIVHFLDTFTKWEGSTQVQSSIRRGIFGLPSSNALAACIFFKPARQCDAEILHVATCQQEYNQVIAFAAYHVLTVPPKIFYDFNSKTKSCTVQTAGTSSGGGGGGGGDYPSCEEDYYYSVMEEECVPWEGGGGGGGGGGQYPTENPGNGEPTCSYSALWVYDGDWNLIYFEYSDNGYC